MSEGTAADETAIQKGQDRALAFTNAPADPKTTSADRLSGPIRQMYCKQALSFPLPSSPAYGLTLRGKLLPWSQSTSMIR